MLHNYFKVVRNIRLSNVILYSSNQLHNVYTVFSLKIIYLYILMLKYVDTNKWNLGR